MPSMFSTAWRPCIALPATSKNRSRRWTMRSAKPDLRFQARNDTDFQNLAEDPRFTELCILTRAPNLSPRNGKKRAPTKAELSID